MKKLKRKYYEIILNNNNAGKIIFYNKDYLDKIYYDVLVDIEYIHWYFNSRKVYLNLKIKDTNMQERIINNFIHKSLLKYLQMYENIFIISDIRLISSLLNVYSGIIHN